MRDSFVFYRSFFEAIEQAEAETQLKLYRAIADYALNGVEPEFAGMAKIAWMLIKMLAGAPSSPPVKGVSPSGGREANIQDKKPSLHWELTQARYGDG